MMKHDRVQNVLLSSVMIHDTSTESGAKTSFIEGKGLYLVDENLWLI